MRRRCYAKNRNGFCNYGGRGIVVCDEWRYDVSSFISWAERSGYKEGLHIDRKDVNGNYESSNCRWVTQKENNRNKRNNILTVDKASEIKDFFARNRNISKKDIAIHFGLKPSMIYDLLTGRSWL